MSSKSKGVTFFQLWGEWFEAHRPNWAPTTHMVYQGIGRDLFSYCRVRGVRPENVNRDHILDLVSRLKARGLKNQTIRRHLCVWNMFFEWIIEDQKMARNPIHRRHLPPLPITKSIRYPISYEEHLRVVEVVTRPHGLYGRPKFRPEWLSAFILGWHTGLRFCDVALLQWDCIDFVNELVKVKPLKLKRYDQALEIPMDPELVQHLQARREAESDLVSVNPFLRDTYTKEKYHKVALTRIFQKANVNKTFHCYRHAFVSRLLNAGVDPLVIQQMTGQTLETLSEYAHVLPERKALALDLARAALNKSRICHELGEPAGEVIHL